MTLEGRVLNDTIVLHPPATLPEGAQVRVEVLTTETLEPWLDAECLAACAAEADDAVSLKEVRAALAKIPGSLADDFIAEREER